MGHTSIQAHYNAIRPTYTADWNLRISLALLFPKSQHAKFVDEVIGLEGHVRLREIDRRAPYAKTTAGRRVAEAGGFMQVRQLNCRVALKYNMRRKGNWLAWSTGLDFYRIGPEKISWQGAQMQRCAPFC